MAFDHFDFDRLGAGLSPKDIDQRNATFGAYIDAGEIVKTCSCTFIDRETLRAIGFDDISERVNASRVSGAGNSSRGSRVSAPGPVVRRRETA